MTPAHRITLALRASRLREQARATSDHARAYRLAALADMAEALETSDPEIWEEAREWSDYWRGVMRRRDSMRRAA